MDGDLSLSQSLGGLRIANPDDSSLTSEDTSTHSQLNTALPSPQVNSANSPSNDLKPIETPLEAAAQETSNGNHIKSPSHQVSPPLYHNTETPSSRVSTRTSVQYKYLDPSASPQLSNGQSALPRTTSTPFHSQPPNGKPPAAAAREGAYRIRTNSDASNVSDRMTRSESRGGSLALQAGVPSRDNSHSERSYKQVQYGSHNGPLPPRMASRALGQSSTTPQLSGSPYSIENGPPASSEEWQERGAAVGVRQEVDANGRTISRYIKKGVRDFSFGHTLGEGSYSTVVLATDRQTLNEYAIKILDKRHIIKEKKVKYVNIEKDTLNRLTDHPGIVRLYYTFQDERSLYFVLDLCKGGELLGVLKRMKTFDEECTRFYGAQILDTIDYMHRRGVIHRDLKPENILLDSQMHTKITDFGTAKILKMPTKSDETGNDILALDSTEPSDEDRASSFVGTAEYVSPELLTDKNACKASDLWAFGCIIFQLLAGRPPFKAANEYLTFQKIVGLEYEFPAGFPPVARDLVERLLVLDPAMRLPIEHIKNHQFFDGITWGRGLWKQKAPRLKAYVPPPREPIKLNETAESDSFPPNISGATSSGVKGPSRTYPRVITELPPPSQLDIEWSPVLTRDNERILKLGNLVVLSSPAPHSPSSRNGGEVETPRKFSRFFGGSTTKKRQRLVMVTSSGRVILAAAGGEEKRTKMEISLLAPGTQYRSTTDSKGFSSWIIDTRDKHLVFEDPKSSNSNPGLSALSAQEWIDTLDRAREMARSQQGNPYSSEEGFRDLSSGFSSQANTIDRSSEFQGEASTSRTTLQKPYQSSETDSVKGKKRFSRRHSKNGLAAVF